MAVDRVHHLNCATMCPLGARWLLPTSRMVAHCVLLETSRDGLVLIETGLGTRDVERKNGLPRLFHAFVRPVLAQKETAVEQVRALGFSPDDVRNIIVTHLDLDHAGGLGDFPKARVHLHAQEHAAAMARASRLDRMRYRVEHWAHAPTWEVYSEDGDTWRGLPAITRLRGIDADIGLVPLYGHTRGHSGVIARHRDGWLVHAGDAYYDRASLLRRKAPINTFARRVQVDDRARRASITALRDLLEGHSDLTIFCAHDVREYEALARGDTLPVAA